MHDARVRGTPASTGGRPGVEAVSPGPAPQGRMTMSEKSAAYEIVPFPPLQRQTIDWLELNRHRHMMYGLIEVDVTDVRRAIREYRARNGASLSLTTFIIHCLARAVDADKAMQAYRLGRGRQVLFADVDVGIMVEREVDGAKIPVPYVVRAANAKSLGQIQHEIRTAQEEGPEGIAMGTLPP